jgi:hypothetical protein
MALKYGFVGKGDSLLPDSGPTITIFCTGIYGVPANAVETINRIILQKIVAATQTNDPATIISRQVYVPVSESPRTIHRENMLNTVYNQTASTFVNEARIQESSRAKYSIKRI